VKTFVELPMEFWPKGWAEAGYRRPVCPLILSLYGHPESGRCWQEHCTSRLTAAGFVELEANSQVFRCSKTGAVVTVYVDDIMVSCRLDAEAGVWDRISKAIDIEPYAVIDRFLGCRYHENSANKTEMVSDMRDFAVSLVERYSELCMKTTGENPRLLPAKTPFVPETEQPAQKLQTWEEMAAAQQQEVEPVAGRLAGVAASVLMKALWLARVSRPDIAQPVCRLARHIARWSVEDDRRLLRLISYVHSTPDVKVVGKVVGDPHKWRLVTFCDADFLSDPSCKSTSGQITGIVSEDAEGSHFWPVSWWSRKQSAIARSTPESELASANAAVYGALIPCSELLNKMLGFEVVAQLAEDNSTCEQVLQRGYSPSLRHLARTHKISLAALSESLSERHFEIYHCTSQEMKADPFTKEMAPAQWPAALSLLSMKIVKDQK
jgi:hypothetical protein